MINIVTTVAEDSLSYTVSFDIIGGTGVYLVDGNPSGSSFTSDPIPCGEPYSFEVTDNAGTATIIVDGLAACTKPCPSAGTLPVIPGILQLCNDGTADFAATNVDLIEGTALTYILFSNPANPFGSIIAVNPTAGEFNALSSDLIDLDSTYYLAAVAGYNNGTGGILFDDECTQLSNTIAIQFNAELDIDVDIDCDLTTKLATVTLTITGGSGPYQVSSSLFNGFSDGTIALSEIEDGTYTVSVEDAIGCTATATFTTACKITPIEWLSFRGEVLKHGNALTWVTGSELNADYFSVERSMNGTNYVQLTTVQATGNSTTARTYSFTDKQAPSGTAYYRIVEVDNDGSKNVSNVISLRRATEQIGFTRVFPVPDHTQVELTFTGLNYEFGEDDCLRCHW